MDRVAYSYLHHQVDKGLVLELLRSEEHTSELQSRLHFVCRLLLEKKNRTVLTGSEMPTLTFAGRVDTWTILSNGKIRVARHGNQRIRCNERMLASSNNSRKPWPPV